MSGTSTRWNWSLKIASWCAFGFAVSQTFASWCNCAFAQSNIVPDNTLGAESSAVTPNVDINGIKSDRIDGGAIRGANLFHSFQEFNIDEGRGAYFTNPAGIENILSRVTGGNASNILGKLGVLGNANLFLINPSGIIFGQNASLDVRGSFVASTASSLNFADGIKFSATTPETTPLLTISIPIGLQYGGTAGKIQQQKASLALQPGKTLALVGGDVNLDGGILQAPGGRVELGGVSGAGTVGLNVERNNLSLNFPAQVARTDVFITNGSEVNVIAGGGGSIAVNARNIDILEGTNLGAGISPLSRDVSAQAGDVSLNATGTLKIENSSVYNAVFGFGNGGDLRVNTGKLIVRDGVLATATFSQGRAGDLIVNASDSVELIGSPASNGFVAINIPIFGVPVNVPVGLFSASRNVPQSLSSFLIGGGKAGDLSIETGRLIVSGGAVVSASTETTGRGGDLTVKADFIELSGTSAIDTPSQNFTIANRVPSGLRNGTDGFGLGGKLTINTRQLIVRDGAWVTTGVSRDLGGEMPGGELTVNASESVELSGISLANGLPSALVSGTQGAGKASPLTINTRQLRVSDGAIISAGTSKSGQGASLTINASESVELIGISKQGLSDDVLRQLIGVTGSLVFKSVEDRPFPSGVITGTSGNGNANNLTINTGRLLIKNGAQASVSTVGAGNAGDLTVNASSVELSATSPQSPNPNDIEGRSLLSTAVGQRSSGKGGDISVQANSVTITDGAAISASSQGTKEAGNIGIQADNLTLKNQALISTETVSNQGGNIKIGLKDILLLRQGSRISTNAGIDLKGGDGGNITINAPNGFIIAVGGENSDITANAFSGSGGEVTIKATDIFGIAPLSRQELERLRPKDLDPRLLTTSDITAISQISPNLSGTITINTPDVDANRGLVNLPTVPLETEVSQICQPRTAQNQSSFTITGRGGLPPNPRTEPLSGDAVQVDWVTLNPRRQNRSSPEVTNNKTPNIPAPIVEAQGWGRNAKGQVVLTANAPTTPHSYWQTPIKCHGS